MRTWRQAGPTLVVASLLVAVPATLGPPAALAVRAPSPAAEALTPFSTPLQRYSAAQSPYPGPGAMGGPTRAAKSTSPRFAAAFTSSVFPPLEAPRFSLRGTLGLGLGLGLNMATFYAGLLATSIFPGEMGLMFAPITAPVHMVGFGLGYGVAGDWGRGLAVGLIGAGLVTLAPLVGYAVGTLAPREPDKPALFADTAPHHGRRYGTYAFITTHALMMTYTAWDTYLTALRVEREAEAQRYGLRPPIAPGQSPSPDHPATGNEHHATPDLR